MCIVHIRTFYRVWWRRQRGDRSTSVKELTLLLSGSATLRGVRTDELQELILGYFEVFGELLGGQVAGHGLSEGVAFLLQQFEGALVILFQGAGPLLVGFLDGLVEGLAFEDEGGELGGLVGGGRQAALGGGDEPDGGVQADGVAEQDRYAPGFLARDP